MANSYLQFSTYVPMTAKEREWVAKAYANQEEESASSVLDDDHERLDFSIEQDETGTVFYAEESGDVEQLASFLQAFLKANRSTGAIGVEFAMTCSKARPGEFGGGAFVVTATEERWLNTGEWVSGHIANIEADGYHTSPVEGGK